MCGEQRRRLITITPLRGWIGALLALSACSTVDRGLVVECEQDSDCEREFICSLAQGNICVPDELPPRAAIGFEIIEDTLRVELTGCDPEVGLELGGSELRVQKRSGLVNDYSIRASTRSSVLNCGGDTCTGTCDEQALTCSEPIAADLTMTMASRLGLAELRNKQSYVPEVPPEGELPKPVVFTWPTYELEDPTAHAAIVLDVAPTAEGSSLSSFRRVITQEGDAEIDAVGVLRCQRGLYGFGDAVRTLSGSPIVGANIEFRYAEPLAFPSTVIGTAPACNGPDECPPGWACNTDAGSCGLDLTGVVAGTTTSTADPDPDLGVIYGPAWLYTYCEEMVAPVDPILRNFTVTVTPPSDSGLPTVLLKLEQGFTDPPTENSVRSVAVAQKLCLPDWQAPQTVGFSAQGSPVKLTTTELGTYSCCSTDCLPSTEPGVEPTPPPMVESCSGFERVRFETRWFNPDLAEWLINCVETASYPDGSNGRFVRDVTTCEGGVCSVGLTAGHLDDLNRTYSIAITQPDGSVFQSQRISRQITAETTELEPFELIPRVLLRGEITCVADAGDDCVAANAWIAAERLRVDTDDPDLPGPFYFDARVDANGKFVLPVDPGVYVITAFPAVGQPGGPSPFAVVDLREDSSLIELVGGVPEASLSKPLQLDEGVLVRAALDGFDISTSVRALDTGSWKTQDDFPADLYDLNDPQTCYSTGTSSGCAIRRLHPSNATTSLLISKRFQFTARTGGPDKCE